MNWDTTLPILVPVAVAVVSALGSGSLVKIFVDRNLVKASAEKTLSEGEVSQSQEYREWVREARAETAEVKAEAKARIDAAEKRMTVAEKKAETAENHVRELEHKVDELGDTIRNLQLQLSHCPGGTTCPIKPLTNPM